ncbi:hypothetical protein CYMTET_18900 [Cymbomonas tetramitiformis]|uniref:Uncharacterized protein n=1 Tax=Cymbomonas tetramitiformis TaxID=36881 RepID=A0AAE0L5S8_9CHLO|nr:hypothetical protein CYMTET_18900 [Cymbomonas tetramitiformis]
MLSSQRQRNPHSRSGPLPVYTGTHRTSSGARGSWFIFTAVILILLAAFKVSKSNDVELSFRREIESVPVNKSVEDAKSDALRELFEKVTKEKLVLTQEQVVLQQEKLVLQQRVRELEASMKQRSEAITSPKRGPTESPTGIPISSASRTGPHPGLSAGSASHVHTKSRVHRLAILVPYRIRRDLVAQPPNVLQDPVKAAEGLVKVAEGLLGQEP